MIYEIPNSNFAGWPIGDPGDGSKLIYKLRNHDFDL